MLHRLPSILLLSVLGTGTLLGQITGNPNVRDPKALALTPEVKAKLCGKTWYSHQMFETKRGNREEFGRQVREIEFHCDGTLKPAGTWTIVNSQFIRVSASAERKYSDFPDGPYSVYALTDSTLVLAKVLTSTGDWTREYYFSTQFRFPKSERPIMAGNPPDSLREGTHIEYYPGGQVQSRITYRRIRQKLSPEDVFLTYQLPAQGRLDSGVYTRTVIARNGKWWYFLQDGHIDYTETYTDGKLTCRDQYEYREGESLPLIRRSMRSHRPTLVIGNKDSVQIDRLDFEETERAGAYIEKEILFKNLSRNPVEIQLQENAAFGLSSTILTLQPMDSGNLVLKFKMLPGEANEQFLISSSEWSLHASLHSSGYNLSSADFNSGNKLVLPTEIFFHRTSDAYELQIKSKSKDKYVPVSKQINTIELKKGQYEFTLIGPEGRKTIGVEVR